MSAFSWMSNPQYLAQVGHFLGGTLAVFVSSVFWGETGCLRALAIGVVLAAFKEFVIDTSLLGFGEGDSWSDSLMDFSFYVIGGATGFFLFVLAVYEHALPGSS